MENVSYDENRATIGNSLLYLATTKKNIKNLNEYINKEITIEGFVDNIRDLQYVQFLIVRDSSGKLQVTIEKNENNKELNEIVSNLSSESTVKITGILFKNEKC